MAELAPYALPVLMCAGIGYFLGGRIAALVFAVFGAAGWHAFKMFLSSLW